LNEGITEEMVLKSDYFQNIIGLINNKYLEDTLIKNGITLYFCIHHMFNIYKEKIVFGYNNIKFIEQNEIFNHIIKANMLVTDFSSVIFEFIYQNKPFVMFIPDSEDPTINKLYNWEYIKLIKDLKGGLIDFRNIFFSINQVVNKIKYYINNDFKVEENLNEFYESFNLTCGNNTIKFINYLENL
jgi:CDP-glycerol glycerophosphotransferase (TagB/SpsB family)